MMLTRALRTPPAHAATTAAVSSYILLGSPGPSPPSAAPAPPAAPPAPAPASARGIAVEPVRTDDTPSGHGARFTFIADPDGLPIELYQPA